MDVKTEAMASTIWRPCGFEHCSSMPVAKISISSSIANFSVLMAQEHYGCLLHIRFLNSIDELFWKPVDFAICHLVRVEFSDEILIEKLAFTGTCQFQDRRVKPFILA